MKRLVASKSFRWLMSLSLSLWMAGAGCRFACGNSVGASVEHSDDETAKELGIAGDSCASMPSHDCCARNSSKLDVGSEDESQSILSLTASCDGLLVDCPLLTNTSAVVWKVSNDIPDSGLVRTSWSVQAARSSNIPTSLPLASLPSNRGPRYLRCCVLLI